MNHTRLSLAALLLAAGLAASSAHALDFGTAIGGGVGAVAGAVIGDSVGGRNGAIVGSGVGGAVGAVIGQSAGEPRYYPAYPAGGYRVHTPPRVVEYHYYEPPQRHGNGWGHRKHKHHHRHDHGYYRYDD
ncbi:glycine zipper domain-containing protein [Azospira restricta]|uniref:Glycine zipper domain-containing protein n=1 Tax=Azospira restricta TaxID=404405 RepID=A0A974SRK9_9RHOO|nr:glycine zipper domain-containing protein [Azospira restricta]QRJ65156.1 hypothetical protein IWH25_07425 [Azospira restricta]